MKNIISWKFLSIFAFAILVLAACEKDDMVKLSPEIATIGVEDITSTSAVVKGYVIAEGDGFKEHGVAYGLEKDPTVDDNKAEAEKVEKALYTATISGLEYLTTYHVRAYSIGTDGTVYYGSDTTFTTLANVPAITIGDITGITATSATVAATVTDDGKDAVTARGFCWSMEQNPTIENDTTMNGTGVGDFTGDITGLIGGITYYVRAYALNGIGLTYSEEKSFTTPAGLAVVTTDSVKEITKVSATVYGNVAYTGGADVTEKGICWSTSANPTIADNTVADGTGTGLITGNITGLTAGTTYHARAYATNSEGTAYGEDMEFTTVADIWKFWVVGDYNGWDNSDNAEYILSGNGSNEAEGYVYLTGAGLKLTTDHSWSDPYTYGDDGSSSGKLANPGNNISVPADGYYFIKANGVDMTYSLTETVWGIMGSFNNWSNQVDMTYDATSKTFRLAQTFVSGNEFKFRGTSDWAINYGSTAADGKTLDAGGSNIPISIDGDYAITLDLSTPLQYSYSANTWGIIGDFNGWGDDVNMTWDAVNSVFTADITVPSDGGFKFRANDDWAVNLGGDINALSPGGDNIAITAGNYTITLDPWAKVATVTQN